MTALLPALGDADTAPSLRARVAGLGRTEHGALLELYALESALARTQARATALRAHAAELERRAEAAHRHARIARSGLDLSHARVAEALRRLYVEGDADPIAVLLGATSVDEALAGLETLERATDRNRRLAAELAERVQRLRGVEAKLASERAALAGSLAAAAAAERELFARVQSRQDYLSSLRRQRSLTASRIQALQDQARAAEQASTRLAASAAPMVSAPAEKPLVEDDAIGTQTMVVDAVAYHLPGRTASGLPVGPGIVAVDPTVIPLGTRMFVPGYGPAIAADVGSAIKGALIDLWFATTAQARAWGRRTVTITIYR